MDNIIHITNQVLPILVLLFLGNCFGRTGFLSDATVDQLKKLVVNLALPAVLFLSFVRIDLHISYLTLFFILLFVCIGLYFVGKLLGRVLPGQSEHLPFMITGFEYGLLALSLFGGAYGLEAVGYIAVVDLGHEFFIWFVYVALLIARKEGGVKPMQLGKMFITSPVIVAILLGLAVNAAGLREAFFTLPVIGAVGATFELVGAMSIPLILIIVGHGIRIERGALRQAIIVVALRAAICIPLALLLNRFVVRELLGMAPPFEAALLVLFIMPPPFILPLFMKGDLQERRLVNSVLAVHTVFSICAFIAYLAYNPTL